MLPSVKSLTLIFCLHCCLTAGTFAQTADIVGEVLEESSQEPLPGTSIALYAQDDVDSTVVVGAITDENGEFVLEAVAAGDYVLEISFVGFVTHRLTVELGDDEVDVGTIELEPSSLLLEGVTVTGEAAAFVNNLDKRVYDVEQDVLSEAGAASDILQNIPLITVGIDGGISLRGTSKVTIFINGRPSAMLRRNAAAVLAQLPAASIERIEIITNPSARYRPDGVGGIINIVMKEEVEPGLNGNVYLNGGTEKRFNTGLALNYGTEVFQIFADYGLRHAEGTNLFDDDRTFRHPISLARTGFYHEAGDSKIDALSHTITSGINIDINDFNAIELAGTYFSQNSFHEGSAEIGLFDGRLVPIELFDNNATNDEFEGEGEASFAFEHIFQDSEDHTLAVEAAYAGYSEHEDRQFTEVYSLPASQIDNENLFVAKSGSQTELVLDYAVPIGEESEFEGGYAGEFIDEDIRYTNNGVRDRFLFDQEIHAFYGLFGHSVENFSFSVGLRAEQTNVSSRLKLPTESTTPNNYFKLFPTLHLGYELDDTRQLSLSYSKRITRPESDDLNPNPEFTDARNAEAGNPLLKPEQVHSFEFGYQSLKERVTFTPTVYYRHLFDAFTTIETHPGDSLVVTTIDNLDTQRSAGFETVVSFTPSDAINLDLGGNVFYTRINAANLGYSRRKDILTGDLRANMSFDVTNSTSIQLNAFYYFPQITPQGRRNRYFFLNGGLRQQLFNNRASLTLTGTDVFHTYQLKRTINSNILSQVASIRRKQPVLYFGFTWRFNSATQKDLGYEEEGLRR